MDQAEDTAPPAPEDIAVGEELSGLVFGVQGKFTTTKKVGLTF